MSSTSALIEALGDQFDRYHGSLALLAAGCGASLALAFAVIQRPARGRLTILVVAVAALLAHQSLIAERLGIVVAIASLSTLGIRRRASNLVPVLCVVSLAGVWAAVPDTEAAVIAGALVALPVGLRQVREVHVGDRVAAAGLVVLVAWTGAAGRSEIVGGLCCLAMLVVPWEPPRFGRDTAALLVGHLVLVVVAARVVTRWPVPQAMVAAAVLAATAAAWGRMAIRPAADSSGRGTPGDADHA